MALEKDEIQIEYWMKQAMEAMEANDGGKQLGRLLDRMPEQYKQQAMSGATQWTQTLSEMDQELARHVGADPGTEDAPEGKVSGFTDAGTENTLQITLGDTPVFQYRPESTFHKQSFARFLTYLESFPQALTRELWMKSVLPPLRHTIGQLFTTQGEGEWEPVGSEWYSYKLNPPKEAGEIGGVSKARLKKIGLRVLDYRGTYRQTLTRTNNLNTKGNIFRPADRNAPNVVNAPDAFDPSRTRSEGWHFGFQFGIDQEWFLQENRQRRGDDFEAEYPSFFEDEQTNKPFFFVPVPKQSAPKEVRNATNIDDVIQSLSKSEYVKYIRRVFVTGREAKEIEARNERIRAQNEQIAKENRNIRANFQLSASDINSRLKDSIAETPVYDGEGNIKARPLWQFFNTERPIIQKFKARVRDNIIRDLARYLDEGQRVEWYGARDSSGRLLAAGDRHFLSTDVYGQMENIPQSLQGIFRSAKNSQDQREIEQMMFDYRKLRAMGAPTPGMQSDMRYLEDILRNVREAGEGISDVDDDVPF